MLIPLLNFFIIFLQILLLLIFIRVVLSWFPFAMMDGWGRKIYELTEPVLRPLRLHIQFGAGIYIDLAPVFAIIIIYQLQRLFANLIRYL